MFVSKIFACIFVFVIFGSYTRAQVCQSGNCPADIDVIPNFDVSKYLGTWYEYAKYPMDFEADGVCIKAEYGLQDDGVVSVTNSLNNGTSGASEEIKGSATVISNAKLLVQFPVSPAYNVRSNYWVLDTDYCSYSVVYSCEPLNGQHNTYVWILTRQRLPSTDTIEKSISVLRKNNISLDPLTLTNQLDC
ncbi:hypothetical protein FF38_08863 [Lucilia cuprina]|uniref:Apolipoprotein D n=1 Tax=Lucilia cuprina TaxID=7375 RepID=A0A0L0BQS3_LUCCU|nr:Apolipoprotein D [Lucilia cuprina]KNC22420.1 hypothetical protein FF38_08863 [Lucilia cuprina]